ncbi:Na+/H+ antiporter subunit A [Pilimelia columellifera]|uniref:Na+/H+ antiporter subunit A n=1 Tax=Pilimelia columellifera subsp. columellifera TaxID=706583 RepID=A0ABN3NRR3_9ACTN
MLELLLLHLFAAASAPWLARWLGRPAFGLLAVVPATGFGWLALKAGAVRDGAVLVEAYPWIAQPRLDLALRLTTLSWVMAMLVCGVGALVLVYCAWYFPAAEHGVARFAGLFVGFAGAMLGLVLSDDLLLLYVFWELTTVFSYLLIGYEATRRPSRRAAMQALLVTTLGGLAMLVGFLILGAHAGSYRWSQIANDLPDGGYLATALALILVGALSKSAIFPFSFWLPAAMAAPTPVSAYLHAAAMVKAGVFLVAQLAPALSQVPGWQPTLLVAGAVTMLTGGVGALRQHDLKLLLAYGTISQLGLLMVVFSVGTRNSALAGVVLMVAHALFKAPLFLVVGIIDRSVGTRDLRELTGLRRRAPALATVTVAATASMAGLPPLAGFVAKEAVLDSLGGGGWLRLGTLAVVVAGSTLTVAYSARFVWGAFSDRDTPEPRPLRRIPAGFLVAPAVLATAGLAVGLLAGSLNALLVPYARAFGVHADDYQLALWHGFTPALGLSAVAVALGLVVFRSGRRRQASGPRWPRLTGGAVYDRAMALLDRFAVEVTGITQRGSLPFYLGVILVVMVAIGATVMLTTVAWTSEFRFWDTPVQLVPATVLVVAAVFAARAQRRLTAVILVGVTGYATAGLFILHGAPDLALTQFLVETLAMVLFVLVLRRLPPRFSERPLLASRRGRITLGVVVGATVAAMSYAAASGPRLPRISAAFPDAAVDFGGGNNVVNVTLVDIRAWDTMGEIAVLVVAATGVASLVYLTGPRPSARARPPRPPRQGEVWLTAGHTVEATLRSPVLEVVTRLLFHIIVLFSLYLLFTGHNTPGGGFAGGLVTALALALRYLAGGRLELNLAAPVDAGLVLGAGLFVAVGTGIAGMALGGEVLQSALLDVHLPVIGDLHLVTSTFFDIGVYLVVVGVGLELLRSLGDEVDRQHERDQRAGQAEHGGT